MNVSLAIGALGVGMGSIAASSGDGSPGESVLAASWLGVGAAAFATAGILYAMEPGPAKPINIMAGPGMVGLRGTF